MPACSHAWMPACPSCQDANLSAKPKRQPVRQVQAPASSLYPTANLFAKSDRNADFLPLVDAVEPERGPSARSYGGCAGITPGHGVPRRTALLRLLFSSSANEEMRSSNVEKLALCGLVSDGIEPARHAPTCRRSYSSGSQHYSPMTRCFGSVQSGLAPLASDAISSIGCGAWRLRG